MNYWSKRAVHCCPTCKYIGSDLKCKKGLMPIIGGREIFYLIGECSSYEGPVSIGE